jgi:hypothetical protein
MPKSNDILKSLPSKDLENPTILLLVEIIRKQQEDIFLLKDEVARLKGYAYPQSSTTDWQS